MDRDDSPNFLIIGSAKCGTTALANALGGHPEIYLPEIKEPQFFNNDDVFERGIEDYLRTHFAGAHRFPARGEATPHYIAWEKAARRIRDLLPTRSHRFIAIFRDPVERAYSLYWNMVYEGYETLDFEAALEREAERAAEPENERRGLLRYRYVGSSLYAQQLETYFRYFDRSRFLLLFQEDLRDNADEILPRVCEFLGVRGDVAFAGANTANPAGRARSRRFQQFLRNPHRIKEPLKRLLPYHTRQRLIRAALQWNKRAAPYAAMRPETEARLREHFAEDVASLARITGADLSHWLPARSSSPPASMPPGGAPEHREEA